MKIYVFPFYTTLHFWWEFSCVLFHIYELFRSISKRFILFIAANRASSNFDVTYRGFSAHVNKIRSLVDKYLLQMPLTVSTA